MSKQLELFELSMEEILRDAMSKGKVPIECIEEVDISDELVARAIVFHEA